MKKTTLAIILLIACACISAVFSLLTRQNASIEPYFGPSHNKRDEGAFGHLTAPMMENPRTRAARRREVTHSLEGGMAEQLESVKVELEAFSRPIDNFFISSTVHAKIANGETLVTGGYPTKGGAFEISFITPKLLTLEDGREGFELSAQVINAGTEFIQENGMDTITTHERNTLQHAEAWGKEDVLTTLASTRGYEGVGFITMPRVTGLLGQSFILQAVNDAGTKYLMKGIIRRTSDGGFAIRSRVERSNESQAQD